MHQAHTFGFASVHKLDYSRVRTFDLALRRKLQTGDGSMQLTVPSLLLEWLREHELNPVGLLVIACEFPALQTILQKYFLFVAQFRLQRHLEQRFCFLFVVLQLHCDF